MGLTDQDWIGCAVSIACDEELGVFQGLIKQISAEEITIVRAFRNGVPLRNQNAEVVLKCTDIRSIDLIEPVKQDVDVQTAAAPVINKPTPVKLPHFSNILGKQQQLQLQQQQQQKQQQFQEQDHELDQPLTPRGKANGYGRAAAAGGGGPGSGSSRGNNFNSTLSDKMHQLKLIETNGSNGIRRYKHYKLWIRVYLIPFLTFIPPEHRNHPGRPVPSSSSSSRRSRCRPLRAA